MIKPGEPDVESSPTQEHPRSAGVARYVVAWLAGTALVVAGLVMLLDDRGDEPVALPPVRQVDLTAATRSARCELRVVHGDHTTNPPVSGPRSPLPASPGFKEASPDVPSLVAALRRGILVIHFRPDLDKERIEELRTIQAAVPEGTIVTPNATGMRYQVAATAHRRLLGCERFTDATLDALRLFRGRFLGSGPDRRP